jgi:hypothetical protein
MPATKFRLAGHGTASAGSAVLNTGVFLKMRYTFAAIAGVEMYLERDSSNSRGLWCTVDRQHRDIHVAIGRSRLIIALSKQKKRGAGRGKQDRVSGEDAGRGAHQSM